MSHSWRLTFAYDGDAFTLKSARKLVKRVPPGQSREANQAGRFVELRGPNREVLYRRAITEIIPETVEYPTGDPARPLGRVPARRRGEVAILVPAPSEAVSVAIVASGRTGVVGKRTAERDAEVGAPRDLIAVELPREGDGK